jgi:glycosyltransferase involved in cell wall biosynthesis
MTTPTMPFVSVIIPVYNDLDRLKICLEQLEKQTYPAERYEIIVVDNASDNPVEPAMQPFPHVRVVHEANPGPDIARNAGLAVASGEILAFTDSDCIPYVDWLEKGVENLQQHPDCGLVGGRVDVFPQDPEKLTWVELYESVFAFRTKINITQYHFMQTCNLFTFKSVFDAVGEFDDSLNTPGDEEWGQRVHAHGFPLIYVDDVAIRHPARRTFKALHKKTKRITFRYIGLLGERYNRPPWLQYKFYKRLFIFPMPSEWRAVFNSNLSFLQKLKVLFVLFWTRCIRAFEMVHALLSQRNRLW